MLTLGHVGMGTGEFQPFDQVFGKSKLVRAEKPDDFDDLDALIIWGGEDISPSLYGESVSEYTAAREYPSYRDQVEKLAIERAMHVGIPIIGICRGAQLLCAMAGGKLIQHVDGHYRDHAITTYDGQHIWTSSVHHQMMYPFDVPHTLLAWTTNNKSDIYIRGNNKSHPDMHWRVEPEIVWFPYIKGLAIQGHPEFMNPTDEFVHYCMELTRKFILNKE